MSEESASPEQVQQAIREVDLEAVREALESSPLARSLGIEFAVFEAGRAKARMPPNPDTANFLGYVHTGALFALAEQTMAAAANTLGYVGLPLNCEVHFLKGAEPSQETVATARVVDTQGRIARVSVEMRQGDAEICRLTEMVFLRSGTRD